MVRGVLLLFVVGAFAGNPIILPSVGLADPHCHVWPSEPDVVYLYGTHDCSKSGKGNCTTAPGGDLGFRMDDWWVWSTTDLVDWRLEATVEPSALAWETNETVEECWATDAAQTDDGSTFFYLSVGPKQIGVVSGPSARGPFGDPIRKALVPEGLVPTYSRDPCVFRDGDGSWYLVWGTFSYYIAKLDASMTALAETPRPLKIDGQQHRDDKPFVHFANGLYYLSWGCFYATSKSSVYGPYDYVGGFIDPLRLANTTFADGGGTSDRHGSFFTFKGQTYFACNDQSHGGGGGFRNTIVSYVHYRANGSIATLEITETGVGTYDAAATPTIEAETYFSASNATRKRETATGFDVEFLAPNATLTFAKVRNVPKHATLVLAGSGDATVDVVVDGAPAGRCLLSDGRCGPLPAGNLGTLELRASGAGALDSLTIA